LQENRKGVTYGYAEVQNSRKSLLQENRRRSQGRLRRLKTGLRRGIFGLKPAAEHQPEKK